MTDIIAIVVGIISFVLTFILPAQGVEVLCYITGILGLVYCSYYLCIWFASPIKRDWILVEGNFLKKVIGFVILLPFVLTAIIQFLSFAGAVSLPILGERQSEGSYFMNIYYHFIDPGNQADVAGRGEQAAVAIVAILGIVFLNGLLISTLVSWFDRRKEQWQEGDIRYHIGKSGLFGKWSLCGLPKNAFAVVIGANEIVVSVIKGLLLSDKNKWVVLQTNRDAQGVRNYLESYLPSEMLKRVIIYKALRNSASEINKLHLRYATEIWLLGESTLSDDHETYHDAMNMQCVNLIAQDLKKSTDKAKRKCCDENLKRKVCKVLFEYQTTYSIFQFSNIPQIVKDYLIFIPFNKYESWARKVIVEGFSEAENAKEGKIEYTPLEGRGLEENSSDFVHFVIVGMSTMGVTMGVQAMLQSHYPNYDKARTRISFIDTAADKEMSFFKGQYFNLFELARTRYIDANNTVASTAGLSDRELLNSKLWHDPMEAENCKWKHLGECGKNFIDLEIEFINGEVESEGVREYLNQISKDPNAKLTIAVCLTQTHQAIAASIYMPLEVYMNQRLQQIWVYQRESADIILNLQNTQENDLRYKKLRPFGMLQGDYMNDKTQYLRAILVNAAYNAVKQYDEAVWAENMTDHQDKGYLYARKKWKELSEDKKWSNRFFADNMYSKIRNALIGKEGYGSYSEIIRQVQTNKAEALQLIGNAFQDNSNMAICEHNRWNVEQLLLGYFPCDRQLDEVFELLNKDKNSEDAKSKYYEWVKTKFDREALEVKSGVKDNYKKQIKNQVKTSEYRIHPNICDYNHLDIVDEGAKDYDSVLNNAIAKIIGLVDANTEFES